MKYTYKEIVKILFKMRSFRKKGYKCVSIRDEFIEYSNGHIELIVFNGHFYEGKNILIHFIEHNKKFSLTNIIFVENNMSDSYDHSLSSLIDYLISDYDRIIDMDYCKAKTNEYCDYIEKCLRKDDPQTISTQYVLRFWFECLGECLWGMNDLAKEKYGYPINLESLGLSDELINELTLLGEEYVTYYDWDCPSDPSPWTEEHKSDFINRANKAYDKLKDELGEDFIITNEVSSCVR